MSRTLGLAKQDSAIEWLLKNENPSVRYWTLVDILGRGKTDSEVVPTQNKITSWTPIADYLGEQNPAGYWADGEDVYWPKWRATVWALILLAEMGVPGTNPSIEGACEHFLRMMDRQEDHGPLQNILMMISGVGARFGSHVLPATWHEP